MAIGNWLAGEEEPSTEAVSVLGEALSDPDPLVRGHGAWAPGRVRSAERLLADRRGVEEDEWVRGVGDTPILPLWGHPVLRT